MTPRLSGHFLIFGLVFFVVKSLLGFARQWSHEKFAILTPKPHSHVRILIRLKLNVRYLQQRFLARYSVATLLQYCFEWLQHRFNIAPLCCAKNHRCELSNVTSP